MVPTPRIRDSCAPRTKGAACTQASARRASCHRPRVQRGLPSDWWPSTAAPGARRRRRVAGDDARPPAAGRPPSLGAARPHRAPPPRVGDPPRSPRPTRAPSGPRPSPLGRAADHGGDRTHRTGCRHGAARAVPGRGRDRCRARRGALVGGHRLASAACAVLPPRGARPLAIVLRKGRSSSPRWRARTRSLPQSTSSARCSITLTCSTRRCCVASGDLPRRAPPTVAPSVRRRIPRKER